jgi:hypothetical protein
MRGNNTQIIPPPPKGSVYFDGASALSTTAVFDNTVSSPFTWECWAYSTVTWPSGQSGIFSSAPQYSCIPFFLGSIGDLGYSSNLFFGFDQRIGSAHAIWNGAQSTSAGGIIQPNTWNYIAAAYDGSTISLYLNGSRIATKSLAWEINPTSQGFLIGRGPNGGFFTGYLTDIRYVLGSTFIDPSQTTISVPTASLTKVSGTQLLLNFDSNADLLLDKSDNNFSISNGGAIWSPMTPF